MKNGREYFNFPLTENQRRYLVNALDLVIEMKGIHSYGQNYREALVRMKDRLEKLGHAEKKSAQLTIAPN